MSAFTKRRKKNRVARYEAMVKWVATQSESMQTTVLGMYEPDFEGLSELAKLKMIEGWQRSTL